jgi:hypothetical protein
VAGVQALGGYFRDRALQAGEKYEERQVGMNGQQTIGG